jgi:hypothetical protein
MIYVIFLKNMNIRRRTELGNETRYRIDDLYRSIDLPSPLSLSPARSTGLPSSPMDTNMCLVAALFIFDQSCWNAAEVEEGEEEAIVALLL